MDHNNLTQSLENAHEEIERLKLELENAHEEYNILFENAAESIFILDALDMTIRNVNSDGARRFGYKSRELIGQPISRLEVIDDPEQQWVSTFSDTRIYESEFRHKDGQLIRVEVSSRDFNLQGNSLVQRSVRIISRRKELEAERLQLIEDLDSFAHTVAHDLKSPISTLFTWAKFLEGEWDTLTVDEIKEYLYRLANSSQQSINLVEELLLFASVRRQDSVLRTTLDMESIINQVLQRLSGMIEESGAEIQLPKYWHTAIGYAPWVVEIWVNYISNAVKYGGQPPKLTLGSRENPDQTMSFWVIDNGNGISQEDMNNLFKSFTRLDETRATGHGLGLSIVKRITEKLYGEVDVESRLGQGSRFGFTLPSPDHPNHNL